MKVTLFILYSAIFALSFLFGTTLAQNVDTPIQHKPPEQIDVRIAKECQPAGATCFLVPPAAMQELEERFTTLKKLIAEKEHAIKELKEYQSKTCL